MSEKEKIEKKWLFEGEGKYVCMYLCKSKGKNKEKGYRDKAIKEACATVK